MRSSDSQNGKRKRLWAQTQTLWMKHPMRLRGEAKEEGEKQKYSILE
jgi:hypothetical protein